MKHDISSRIQLTHHTARVVRKTNLSQ